MSHEHEHHEEIARETKALLEAILRLCKEADHHESSLNALALAAAIIAKLAFGDNPCCVLADAFVTYMGSITVVGAGDDDLVIKGTPPQMLIESMMRHLTDAEVFSTDTLKTWANAAIKAASNKQARRG